MAVFSGWAIEAAYDYTRLLSVDAWAWEFLRRNADYAADWERATDSLAADRIPIDVPFELPRHEAKCFSRWGLIFR